MTKPTGKQTTPREKLAPRCVTSVTRTPPDEATTQPLPQLQSDGSPATPDNRQSAPEDGCRSRADRATPREGREQRNRSKGARATGQAQRGKDNAVQGKTPLTLRPEQDPPHSLQRSAEDNPPHLSPSSRPTPTLEQSVDRKRAMKRASCPDHTSYPTNFPLPSAPTLQGRTPSLG